MMQHAVRNPIKNIPAAHNVSEGKTHSVTLYRWAPGSLNENAIRRPQIKSELLLGARDSHRPEIVDAHACTQSL